ncbi:hypothetical protein SUDANB58_00239 [Streptomyces sp. enrichment culture]|uniref:hypothetical protein n=1 Tax=Streptomyces sp. enrichment culture TaxID=1795815 RepID=UPI003F571215
MRSGSRKAGVLASAGALAGLVLTGCGDGGGTGRAADDASPGGGVGAREEGTRTGGGAGAREEGTRKVRSAYDRTAEAETARMAVRVRMSAEGETVTADGRGVIDLTEGDSVLTVTAGGERMEQRVVDQVLYQKLPDQQAGQGKPWMKVDLRKAAGQQGTTGQPIGDPAQSAAFAKAITDQDVTRTGTATVDGVDTTRYRVTVDVAELPGGAALRRQVGDTLPMQIWLDEQGRIRRQQIDLTIKAPASAPAGRSEGSASPRQMKMSTLMEFSDFGTEVDVEAPPAGQVTDATGRAAQSG